MKTNSFLGLSCFFVLSFAVAASAETRTWTGGAGDGNWLSPGNWDPSGEPAAGDTLELKGDVTISSDVTIPEDTKVISSGSGRRNFGNVENNGTIEVSGNTRFAGTSFTGSGLIDHKSDELEFYASINSPETTLNIYQTDGNIGFGSNDGATGFPVFGGLDPASRITRCKLRPGVTAVAPAYLAAFVQKTLDSRNEVEVMMASRTAAVQVENATWNFWNLGLGYGGDHGRFIVGDGGTLNVTDAFYLGRGQSPEGDSIVIKAGGTLNLNRGSGDYLRIGNCDNRDEVGGREEIVVDGGSFNVPNTSARLGYNSRYAYVTLNSGTVSAKGFRIRDRWTDDVNPNNSEALFSMQGGTLELGGEGFTTLDPGSKRSICFIRPMVDLAGGTFRPTEDISLAWGRIPTVFGDSPATGRALTVDLNGKTVAWNGGLGGGSDVTLTGTGTFGSSRMIQNVAKGKWTVNAGATADLSGASGFAGGLELKPNAMATVAVPSEGLVEMMVKPHPTDDSHRAAFDDILNYTDPFPYVVNSLEKLHEQLDASLVYHCTFSYRGQFYVPEEKAGVWYFAGTYDDGIAFYVDSTAIFENTGWNDVARGNIELTAGWHDFLAVVFDKDGGQGPSPGDWKGKMALGYTLDSSAGGSYSGDGYTRFDTDTVKMRLRPGVSTSVARLQISGKGYDSNDFKGEPRGYPGFAYGAADRYVTTLDGLHVLNALADLQGKSAKFSGWFELPADLAGVCKFKCQYDDNLALVVDGVEISNEGDASFSESVEVTLTAGWHKFEITVRDGAGDWGGKLTDKDGKCSAVMLRTAVDGEGVYRRFDETNFRMVANAAEASRAVASAGLGGTVKLGAGSTLSNVVHSVIASASSCPISGTLEGTGKLVGAFHFTSDATLKLTGNAAELTEVPDFSELSNATAFKGLRHIRVDFSARPTASRYTVGPAGDLTAAEAEAIEVAATDQTRARAFHATVVNGDLTLVNDSHHGMMILFR